MSDPTAASVRHTILIVDDTPDNLVLMSNLLRQFYQIKVANNGERALKMASSDPIPDLILLDVMMPSIDGYCRKIRGRGRETIPVKECLPIPQYGDSTFAALHTCAAFKHWSFLPI